MDKNVEWLNEYLPYMAPVLSFSDIVIQRGQGSYVWDMNGEKFLDLNCGQFCAAFGHSNPDVAEVVKTITGKIQDTNTSTLNEDCLVAAKKMNEICLGMNGKTIFLSTGAEANECCLRYAKHLSGNRPGVISFDVAYHGLSHGTEGYSMARKHVKPGLEHAYVVDMPKIHDTDADNDEEIERCLNQFENIMAENGQQIAVAIFEPIASSGGFYMGSKKYFQRVREICDQYQVFLAFDECQTGFGRTGNWFAYQQLECIPDFLICAKSIGLGYPVSAVVFRDKLISGGTFKMQHYSSHQNEPFSGAIVSFAIEYIKSKNLLGHISTMGDYLLSMLRELSQKHRLMIYPRGMGLMCAFDLDFPQDSNTLEMGTQFCKTALNHGIMIQQCNSGKTIRLLPSYLVTKAELDYFCTQLDETLKTCEEQQK
ncbi:MAG: aspartate aminotransferase family protein [Oscillospiraceae bacterium]